MPDSVPDSTPATAAYDPDDDLYALGVCTDNPPACPGCGDQSDIPLPCTFCGRKP